VAFHVANLAPHFVIRQPPSGDIAQGSLETVAVVAVAMIVAERLFIDVTEQVERLDADICSVNAALQKTPEVLQAVGVNVALHVGFGVVDYLMGVHIFQPVVGLQCIGEHCGAGRYIVCDNLLNILRGRVRESCARVLSRACCELCHQ